MAICEGVKDILWLTEFLVVPVDVKQMAVALLFANYTGSLTSISLYLYQMFDTNNPDQYVNGRNHCRKVWRFGFKGWLKNGD